MKKLLLLITLFVSALNGFSQSKIEIGEKHKLFSSVLNEDREYWVYLPPNYNDTIYQPQNYAVVYFLDGDRHFHSLTGIQDFLSVGPYASLPQMIYVGILTKENRSRDLTPTKGNTSPSGEKHDFPNSGGNADFLKFVASELVPEITKTYRTNGYKTLIGHSFGGLTVFNTLLTQPELFNSYIAIDPSIWWDNTYILKKAKSELGNLNLKGKRLYLAQANNIPRPGHEDRTHENAIMAMKSELETHKNNGLQWTYEFYENDDHGTISLPSEYFGLRYIYKGYQSQVKVIAKQPESLVEAFNDFSNTFGFKMKPEEARVDWIANYCLKIDKEKSAIALFKINQNYYPNSMHTYLVLGDYYTGISDVINAKKEYQKALLVNPKSEIVLKKLKTLD